MFTDDALGLNRAYQIGTGANLPLTFDLFLSLRQALKLQLTINFYFILIRQVSGRATATALANYCGPVRARPQHQELHALLFTNSV